MGVQQKYNTAAAALYRDKVCYHIIDILSNAKWIRKLYGQNVTVLQPTANQELGTVPNHL